MITLYSYPALFGAADNNPYGLKVFACLRLAGVPFRHEHILDPSAAPRGQLPYITDGDLVIGDSDAIVSHVIAQYAPALDATLTTAQRDTHLLIRRTLDDLYWVMSFSRWKDDRYWPQFRDALLRTHPELSEASLVAAREFNFQRYHYQGIGRFAPEQAYARGLEDLRTLAHLLPPQAYMFGATPGSVDAGLYGFIANIHFYDIDTPLKEYLETQPHLIAHCLSIHTKITPTP